MQRLPILLICWILLCPFLGAQPGVEVQYYTPVEQAGGGYAAATPYTLLCKADHSLFFKGEEQNSLEMNEQRQQIMINLSTGENWVYKDLRRLEMQSLVSSIQEKVYRIDEVLPRIDWQILPEKKAMGALSVQKARGHFRGRDYTAWFAPSIPLAGGPWKLGGLPGLILEAYDDERLVVFLFKAIQLREDLTVERPEMKTPGIDLYTYQEIFRQEVREYFRFLNARLREDGSGLSYQLGAFEMWERLDQSPNH